MKINRKFIRDFNSDFFNKQIAKSGKTLKIPLKTDEKQPKMQEGNRNPAFLLCFTHIL